MALSKNSEAKDFLIKIGLHEYVEELVTKNKFETLSDLQMLKNLEDNIFQKINIPLCVILKLRNKLRELSTEQTEDDKSSMKVAEIKQEESPVHINQEIKKTNLLELQSVSMDAQFANSQLNAFTSFLAAKVNEFQHQGKDKKRGQRSCKISTTKKNVQVKETEGLKEGSENEVKDDSNIEMITAESECEGHQQEEVKDSSSMDVNTAGSENETGEQEESDFLKQRRLNIEANNKQMLKIGLLTASQGTIITLFYLQVKQCKFVQMKRLREECKKNKLAFKKSSKKDELCAGLGKLLFDGQKIVRIDEEKPICFDNLKLGSCN